MENKIFKNLPSEPKETLPSILNTMTAFARLPPQIAGNLQVMCNKPSEDGGRPIMKIAMLYRV